MHFWHINLNRWMEEKMMKNGDEKLSKIENICRPMARVATVITIIVFVVFVVVAVVSIVCLRTTATDIKCIQTKIVMAKEQGHTTNYIHIYFCSVFDSLVTDFLWIKFRNGTRHQLKSNFINWSVPSFWVISMIDGQSAKNLLKTHPCPCWWFCRVLFSKQNT